VDVVEVGMAQKCPKCQTVNSQDSQYCKKCATALPADEAQASFTKTLETPAVELARGTVFAGRYEIIEELGVGGMGRVYRAHDTKLGEEVALKLIKPEIAADRRVADRFRNELKVARKIRHKNVCGMYDFHEEGHTLFLTMEYVRGEDLKSFIKRSKVLSTGTAVSIARQTAEGLGEAHKLGIVHRDLKPGNIMVDKEGNAKIMDFGIARSLFGGGVTGEGAIIGTPEYMSPEQVEGKPADARSDIYALGVILFEMIVGRTPFEGDTPFSIANKHKNELPPVPKKLLPQIPESLSRLILRCLEKDKAKRYQTTEELIAELAAVEGALPTSERVVSRPRTITRREVTVKFQPRKLVIPAAAVLVLAVGGFLLWIKVINPPTPPLPAAKPTLALLPLRNSSGDPSLDNWKESLPTMLNGGLSQSGYLRVLNVFQVYGALKKLNLLSSDKYTPEELKNIAADGGATHFLSGNYFRAGGKFIINLSLIDAKTGADIDDLIQEEALNENAIQESVDSLVKKVKTALNIPEKNIDKSTYKTAGEIYPQNPQALQYFIEGEKAHYGFEYDKATQNFEKAIELDPNFAMAYRLLGVVAGNQRDFATKYRYIRKAYELRDKLPEYERLFAEGSWFFLREGTMPQSKEAFEKIVELYPNDYQGLWNKAIIIGFFDLDESIREYEYLLHLPGQAKALNLYSALLESYLFRGDRTKARETWEGFLTPSSPPWHHIWLAWLFQLEGNLAAAKKEYEVAIALDPDNPEWKVYLTNIDWIREDHDRVLNTLNDIRKAQKDPSFLDDYFYVIFMEQGKFREAQAIGDRKENTGLSGGGSNVSINETLTSRGKEFLQTGRPQIALEKLRLGLEYIKKEEDKLPEKDFVSLIHERRVSLIWQICALCDMGRLEEAQAVQKELESLIPTYIVKGQKACECVNTALPAGRIALANKDAAAAIKALEYSRQIAYGEHHWRPSDHAYLSDLLGEAYWLAGRLDKAAEAFAGIRELQTGRQEWGALYARSYYKLGKVFEQMGKKAEAAEKYRKFLDLWKDADAGLLEVEDAKKRLAAIF
jgi:serine/threonine protein kinase/tetratricopeptide (TPR) repeat protein